MFIVIFGFDGEGIVDTVPFRRLLWRCRMPWYWTDEVAPILLANGSIASDVAVALASLPVAHRSDRDTIEAAAQELMDEGEIPLAA